MNDVSERLYSIRLLIEMDEAHIANFHSAGCPAFAADTAKAAFDRIQGYRSELERIALTSEPYQESESGVRDC